MKKQMFRERECIHRGESAEGELYKSVLYVQALQLLPVDQALKVAGKVSSFFWSDASHILVWLCQDCAATLELNERPRSIAQSSRRQA